MKKFLLTAIAALLPLFTAMADKPWKCRLYNAEEQNNLVIDLYEESVDVPGMDMFGPMNGYLNGKGIYGIWVITSCQIKDDHHATIRLSSDLGADTQEADLTIEGDSIYHLDLRGTTYVKKVNGRKLVKVNSSQTFRLK